MAYKLPDELPKDLRLDLRRLENIGKISNLVEACSLPQIKLWQ